MAMELEGKSALVGARPCGGRWRGSARSAGWPEKIARLIAVGCGACRMPRFVLFAAVRGPRARSRKLLTCVALGYALSACGAQEGSGTSIGGWPQPLHIVWVVLDATPASELGTYGYERPISPHIDELARESVVFERAYAQAPLTLVSTASFLTGRYPRTAVLDGKLAGPAGTLLMRQRGYRTIAFSENPWISPAFGFDQAFEEIHVISPMKRATSRGAEIFEQARRDTARTIDRALEWMRVRRDVPFFAYLHLLPPHTPYNPPAPFRGRFVSGDPPLDGPGRSLLELALGRGRDSDTGHFWDTVLGWSPLPVEQREFLRDRYDENLAYADHQVGRLVTGMHDALLLDSTLLIVSSDHGEAFGQHGQFLHASSVYDEQVRVPLIVRLPQTNSRISRIATPVELVDVMPTILEAAGVDTEGMAGESLLSALRGDELPRRPVKSFLSYSSEGRRKTAGFAVVKDHWKLIAVGDHLALFDLEADPQESHNVADRHSDIAEALYASVDPDDLTDAPQAAAKIDPITRSALEALGYFMESEASGPREPRSIGRLPPSALPTR